jgi:hypothetical protein
MDERTSEDRTCQVDICAPSFVPSVSLSGSTRQARAWGGRCWAARKEGAGQERATDTAPDPDLDSGETNQRGAGPTDGLRPPAVACVGRAGWLPGGCRVELLLAVLCIGCTN